MDMKREFSSIKRRQADLYRTIAFLSQIAGSQLQSSLREGLGHEIIASSRAVIAFSNSLQTSGLRLPPELIRLTEKLQTNLGRFCDKPDNEWIRCAPAFWNCVATTRIWCSTFEATVLNGSNYVGVLVEAALEDLRARLATESSYRKDWQDAYDKREDDLEKLGGALFRQRDIWAFKAGGDNQVTDLILDERPNDPSSVHPSARGNILTEWKVIKASQLSGVKTKLCKDIIEKGNKRRADGKEEEANKLADKAERLRTAEPYRVAKEHRKSSDWRKKLQELALEYIEEADTQSNIYQNQVLHNAPLEKVHYLFIVSPDSIYLPPHKGKLFKGDDVEVRIRIIDLSDKPFTPSEQSKFKPLITMSELKEALGI